MPFLEQGMVDLIVRGQAASLVLALAAVFVIVYLLLGRSRDSALCLVPIALTILVNFGMMGWAGIPFDIVTALVSSIAVGIGIDYGIHVYSRFRQGMGQGMSPEAAMHATIANTGRAIMTNALAVTAGFAVLLLSVFPPLRHFGGLVAVTMIISSIGSLTILPALLLAVRRKAVSGGVWGADHAESTG
jgi:predicted RND superfamily exporter protein